MAARAPTELDVSKLSAEGWETLHQIAVPLTWGYDQREIARLLGIRPNHVTRRLVRLRAELLGAAKEDIS